jgi:hypothetical protein
MNEKLFAGSGVFLLAVALLAGGLGTASPPAAPPGARILAAATDLFDSLNEKERAKALVDFKSRERFDWHFIPKERKGIPLKDLEPAARTKVLALLSASLSEKGARLVQTVMSHEDILREIEGSKRRFPRDPLLYHLTFFSRPSREGPWGYSFEGHHLSVNVTLEGERVLSATPLFYGANPAIVREGPQKGLRILAGVEDLARDLVRSLKEPERKACLAEEGGAVPEEVPAGKESVPYSGSLPAGVSADSLGEDARAKLGELIAQYTNNLPAEIVQGVLEGGLKGVRVAWRGSLEPYQPHSYLVHGPGFVISYTNRQDGAAHIHSCFRSLKGEFGLPPESKG